MAFRVWIVLVFAVAIGGEVRSQDDWKTYSFPYLVSVPGPQVVSRLIYGNLQTEDATVDINLQRQATIIAPSTLQKLGLTGKYLELNTPHQLRGSSVKVEIFPNTIDRFLTKRTEFSTGAIVGLDVLHGSRLTLDAQERKLTIRSKDRTAAASEQTELTTPTINVHIANASYNFELNVAQNFSLRISEATFAKIKNSSIEKLMPIDIGTDGLEIYRFNRIEVGNTTMENVLAKVGGATDCVGLPLLNRFIVDIDEVGNVKLSPNDFDAFHDHSFNDGSLMEYRMNAKGVREKFVKKVLVGSAVERAGLKVGDHVAKMTNDSGENTAETDDDNGTAGGLLLLVPRTKPLPIEILRDGRKITIELESDMINKN